MKLYYLANIRLPTEKAHGIQIIKMCEAFARAGLEVELLVPRRRNFIREDPFSYYNVAKIFKIRTIPAIDFLNSTKFGFWLGAFSFSIASIVARASMKDGMVYSRDELPLWVLGFFGKTIVWEVHMPRDNRVARALLKRCKKIVAISQGLKRFYETKKIPKESILVAHDGVDLEDFVIEVNKKEIKKNLGLPEGVPIVMYVGRLDPWKGVQTLLDAAAYLPGVQVVIIGEGDQLARFKERYKNVIFTGYLPYRDLPKNQKVADVLVIPNSKKSIVSAQYTSPLKVFAHMASGVPMVVSDLPSLREVLSEESAMFVNADDPQALAKGIESILADRRHGALIAEHALVEVKKYTWDKRAERIMQFIQS